MGKRGPAPKPTKLRVLQGEKPYRINNHEPEPHERDIAPPYDLGDVACEVWNRLAPDLIACKVLTPWDAEEFAVFCDAAATYRKARGHLETYGYIGKGAGNSEIKSPYWQIMRDAASIMTTVGSRFGLTPSDRAQLSIEQPEQKGKDASRLLG
ncbi:MAG: phage terminase small subunit P27 family [Sciscionella sp.]